MKHFLTSIIETSRLTKIVFGLTMLLLLTPSSVLALSTRNTASVATPRATADIVSTCTKRSFLGLEPWYQYLGPEFDKSGAGKCDLQCFNLIERKSGDPNDCGQTKSDVPLVLLAVIDDLLRVAGLIAVGYVIYGAFQYTASQGNGEATARAQATIVNALIGMALAIISVVIVSYIGNAVGS